MIAQVTDARYIEKYTIWIKFNDGSEGEVDLKDELWGSVFEPLKDIDQFRKFSVHPDYTPLRGRMVQISHLSFFTVFFAQPPNGPELSCGNEVPQRRNPVRAWQVMSNSSWLIRARKSSTAGSVSLSDWFRAQQLK